MALVVRQFLIGHRLPQYLQPTLLIRHPNVDLLLLLHDRSRRDRADERLLADVFEMVGLADLDARQAAEGFGR